MAEIIPIPEPPGLPLLGNITNINPDYPLGSMVEMAEKHGEQDRSHSREPRLQPWTKQLSVLEL